MHKSCNFKDILTGHKKPILSIPIVIFTLFFSFISKSFILFLSQIGTKKRKRLDSTNQVFSTNIDRKRFLVVSDVIKL